MPKRRISSEKKLTKLDVSLIPKKHGEKKNVKATNNHPHQCTKIRRTVKLPRLKLEDLVAQVTEENAHEEISTGPAVGNEV